MATRISIVIPSYKGSNSLEKNLPYLISEMNRLQIQAEIIIVDDGSEDKGETKQVADNYQCVYLENPVNQGKGAAVRRGMLHASGDLCFFTDADLPFETSAFPLFISYLQEKEFHVVIGDRTLERSEYFEKISVFRKLGSIFFTFFVTRFVTGGLSDTQCGLKGFRKDIAKDLFSVSKINSFAFDVEILYIALKRNYDIKRLPVQLRNNEESTVSLLRHAPGMLKDIFSVKMNHILGKYSKSQ